MASQPDAFSFLSSLVVDPRDVATHGIDSYLAELPSCLDCLDKIDPSLLQVGSVTLVKTGIREKQGLYSANVCLYSRSLLHTGPECCRRGTQEAARSVVRYALLRRLLSDSCPEVAAVVRPDTPLS